MSKDPVYEYEGVKIKVDSETAHGRIFEVISPNGSQFHIKESEIESVCMALQTVMYYGFEELTDESEE